MAENYSDWWWEDMPPKAHQAAEVIGYTRSKWDDDESIPYDSKPFAQCTLEERHAAFFLGMDPMDKLEEFYWDDLDEDVKKAAEVLGWDRHKWDDDWAIEDLPCEHLWWEDLTEEQREAARFFGYSRCLWNEDGDDKDEHFEKEHHHPGEHHKPPPPHSDHPKPPHHSDEAKPPSQTSTSSEEQHEATAVQAASSQSNTQSSTTTQTVTTTSTKDDKKDVFSASPYYGGEAPNQFDHGNHRAIKELVVYSDKHVVRGIEVVYRDGVSKKEGSDYADKHTYVLDQGEYITSVRIRFRNHVQCLTFNTSKGMNLGPCGGKGWLIGKDKEGEEILVKAPSGCQLCGLRGRYDKDLQAISFRWGPVP